MASYRCGCAFAATLLVALVAGSAQAVELRGGSRGRSTTPRIVGVIGGPAVVIVQTDRVVYPSPQPAAPRMSPPACPATRETYVDGAGVSHAQIKRTCF